MMDDAPGAQMVLGLVQRPNGGILEVVEPEFVTCRETTVQMDHINILACSEVQYY